jgi:phospholipid/cholesterol/gamma-HCH transport system substrate-binding protein
MRSRQGTASLVASPVLVGAVTVLITIIAVFISYNANKGLPFVPTYDLKAELPSGAKLVKGNEVRTGGFRVGVIDNITPKSVPAGKGKSRTVAVVTMKLDKKIEPLGRDTTVRVRPRSALGLKYVELTPGHSRNTYAAGSTMPLKNASEPLDFEDFYGIFDRATRPKVRKATEGFGDAFAGRGTSINTAIEELNPFLRHLTPVMTTLADRDTHLDEFFRQLGRASAQVAPVAHTQAVLFTNMADTFEAISADPRALQQTIEKSPGTEDVGIRSFRVQQPFLADFTDLSRRLRPAAAQLPRSLPAINSALKVGTPVLPKTVPLNERFGDVFDQLDKLMENPNTLLTLKDLRTALSVTRPAIEFIAPYQTVCNYPEYFLLGLGEHQSLIAPDKSGTVQNQGLKLVNQQQPNNYGTLNGSRNVDVRPGMKARGAKDATGTLHRLQAPLYSPAIDAQGNADCQRGQEGYPNGPLATGGRYGKGQLPDGTPAGGNAINTDDNYPILSGGTNVTRKLGIKNLKDVP